MKKVFNVTFLVLLAVAFISCSKTAKSTSLGAQTSSEPPAIVNGTPITATELDEAAKKQLQRVETEIYQIKKQSLDDLIEAKLIADAAKKEGLSTEKYLAKQISTKVTEPTEEEIKALYDSNKDKMGKSFDEVKTQIKDYLMQGKKSRARAELISQLKSSSDIKMNLEPPRVELDIKDAPAMGDKNAKVTLVEFSDYQCPFCKRVRPTIFRLLDEYKGKLRYVFADFPLSFHKDAKKAHEAAHCAGDQEKYFEYSRKLFDNQTAIKVEDLKKYAKELQLNTKEFDQCLDSGKHAKDVEKLAEAGAAAGVSGTPAYFINGIMLSGALPYDSFKEIIDAELKR